MCDLFLLGLMENVTVSMGDCMTELLCRSWVRGFSKSLKYIPIKIEYLSKIRTVSVTDQWIQSVFPLTGHTDQILPFYLEYKIYLPFNVKWHCSISVSVFLKSHQGLPSRSKQSYFILPWWKYHSNHFPSQSHRQWTPSLGTLVTSHSKPTKIQKCPRIIPLLPE